MRTLYPLPKFLGLDSSGSPVNAGRLHTYEAGTTTNLATYTDASGSTANANPVVLNAGGQADVWFDASKLYKLELRASNDTTVIWTVDNVGFPFTQAGTGAVARPAELKARDVVSVKDFGAVGDGVANDTAAIQAAINYAAALGGATVDFPAGTYKIASTSTVSYPASAYWPSGISITAGLHTNTQPNTGGYTADFIILRGDSTGGNTGGSQLNFTSTSADGLDITKSGGITIKDLTLKAASGSTGWGIRGEGSGGYRIDNSPVNDFKNGYKLIALYGVLENCRFGASIGAYQGGIGIQLGDSSAAEAGILNVVRRAYVAGVYNIGIKVDRMSITTIYDPIVEYSTTGINVTDYAIGTQIEGQPYFEFVTTNYNLGNSTTIVNGALGGSTLSSGIYNKSYGRLYPTYIEARPTNDSTAASGSTVQVPMDYTAQSSGGNISLSSNNIVISEPGYYNVNGSIAVVSTGTSARYIASIKHNGSDAAICVYHLLGNGEETIGCLYHSYFRQGDTIGLFLNQNSGSARDVYNRSRLWVEKRTY